MILVGSDDGVYHISDVEMSTGGKATKTLDSERVMRLRQFEGVDGVFAATNTGLYRSLDGKQWTEIDTPHETVYAVAAVGDQLYIGTRPAHIYVTATASISPSLLSVLNGANSMDFRNFHRVMSGDSRVTTVLLTFVISVLIRRNQIDSSPVSKSVVSTSVTTAEKRGPSDPVVSMTTFTNSTLSVPESTSRLPVTGSITRMMPVKRGHNSITLALSRTFGAHSRSMAFTTRPERSRTHRRGMTMELILHYSRGPAMIHSTRSRSPVRTKPSRG
ncbi:hypothetical protein ACFQL7_08200 [Halocatena marina]|uniref:Photosynthesis system II assembly factor Ycf48/Hcf136-like domain-containing protein n=1 Tax=Halocatena marina TaxID=2934937 RepID=A0ABD5YTM4_9EURY